MIIKTLRGKEGKRERGKEVKKQLRTVGMESRTDGYDHQCSATDLQLPQQRPPSCFPSYTNYKLNNVSLISVNFINFIYENNLTIIDPTHAHTNTYIRTYVHTYIHMYIQRDTYNDIVPDILQRWEYSSCALPFRCVLIVKHSHENQRTIRDTDPLYTGESHFMF